MSFFETDRSILHSLASSAPHHTRTRHVSLCQNAQSVREVSLRLNTQSFQIASSAGSWKASFGSPFLSQQLLVWRVCPRVHSICRLCLLLWDFFVVSWHDSSSWCKGWMVFLLVPRADTSAVWSRCVSLTCLESGVTHILSVAVADRFGILVADQGQMLDTERRTYTASSKIWMEQLTCSLLSCHCEARNQWLVAWDKSNWQFQKRAQQHWLSKWKQVFEKWCKEDPVFMLEMLDTETRIFWITKNPYPPWKKREIPWTQRERPFLSVKDRERKITENQ